MVAPSGSVPIGAGPLVLIPLARYISVRLSLRQRLRCPSTRVTTSLYIARLIKGVLLSFSTSLFGLCVCGGIHRYHFIYWGITSIVE